MICTDAHFICIFTHSVTHLLHILLPGARATAAGSGDSVVGLDVLSSNCLAWAVCLTSWSQLCKFGIEIDTPSKVRHSQHM